jgi:hypothetical protein
MTMGPWWCSRESRGLRPVAGIRLPRRFRGHIVGAAVLLMGMRRPLWMVGGIFAAFRAPLSRICYWGNPLRASGLSGTARPHLGGIFSQLIGLSLVA